MNRGRYVMRGRFQDRGGLFSCISPEARVPARHPLRRIWELVRAVLKELGPSFAKLYSSEGRPSIPPEICKDVGGNAREQIPEGDCRAMGDCSRAGGAKNFRCGSASAWLLVNILWCPINSPLKGHAKQLENLPQFSDRMKRRFFSPPSQPPSPSGSVKPRP